MNPHLISALRTAALATTLLILPTFASATDSAATDRAAEILRTSGCLPVQAAGPYVAVGTYQIQVSVKLGRASAVLPDGTWLYESFVPENSTASGTLVVRFANGRVSDLSLVTPGIATAMRSPKQPTDKSLVARLN